MSDGSQRLRAGAYALVYTHVLPQLQSIAREHGYALCVHGSMHTDLDLVACPWTEEAKDPFVLIEALRIAVNGFYRKDIDNVDPTPRPHGRLAWSIYLNEACHGPYLDVSVYPRENMAIALERKSFQQRIDRCDDSISEMIIAQSKTDPVREKLLQAIQDAGVDGGMLTSDAIDNLNKYDRSRKSNPGA